MNTIFALQLGKAAPSADATMLLWSRSGDDCRSFISLDSKHYYEERAYRHAHVFSKANPDSSGVLLL